MNRITPLLVVAAAAATIGSINAQDTTTAAADQPTMCSCSPTSFTFTLSLSQTCNNNTIEGNTGIDGSYCFTEEGVAIPAPPAVDNSTESVTMTTSAITIETRDSYSGYSHYGGTEDDGPVRRVQDDTAADAVTEIVSVQFLEFDTSGDLTVINQDDTYADVSLGDGDRLKFNSASSFLDTSLLLEDQMSSPALVPGGASLILYGKTESGVVVRNRFFWMYNMNCGEENDPVQVDDTIGWVTVAETSNAWPTFCPALPPGSPTIAPRTNEPTLTPSGSPTLKPITSNGMSMQTTWGGDGHSDGDVIPTDTTVDHGDSSWGGTGSAIQSAFGSKSSKQAKTMKPTKAAKGASSKSGKSSKGSKSSSGGDHWGGANQVQKVTGYDVSSSVSVRSGLALVVSFVLAGALSIC